MGQEYGFQGGRLGKEARKQIVLSSMYVALSAGIGKPQGSVPDQDPLEKNDVIVM